jgi:hypothetical protein
LTFKALKTSLSGNTIPRHGQIDNPYQLISETPGAAFSARLLKNALIFNDFTAQGLTAAPLIVFKPGHIAYIKFRRKLAIQPPTLSESLS